MGIDVMQSAFWDESAETALAALAEGMATVDELQAAINARRQSRPAIGQLALQQRKLKVAQVFEILQKQAGTNRLFGETAVELGFLEPDDVHELLQLQASRTPPLSDVLERLGVLTPEQAEMLRAQVRSRLRCQSEPDMASHAD